MDKIDELMAELKHLHDRIFVLEKTVARLEQTSTVATPEPAQCTAEPQHTAKKRRTAPDSDSTDEGKHDMSEDDEELEEYDDEEEYDDDQDVTEIINRNTPRHDTKYHLRTAIHKPSRTNL